MNFLSKLILTLTLVFLKISRELRASQCHTSIDGIALREHNFLSFPAMNIHLCYQSCKEKRACQSINYFKTTSMCQLNNRSISSNPAKKMLVADSVYFEHPEPALIGSLEETPAETCMEIKNTTNTLVSGFYWLKHPLTSIISKIYCNMKTGEADGCYTSPCKNQGTCHNMKHGDYNCTCTAAFKGVNCELPAIDACQPKPCQNGGTCSNSGADYQCACVSGYIGKNCDVVSSAECSSYTNNTDATRSVNHGISAKTCDNSLVTKWYRFTGLAGNRIPTSCTPKSRCNTDATGWLSGAHPSPQHGIVSRTVCFHWSSKCCNWNVVIRVRNCGTFFVYELKNPGHCSLRYCVTT